MLLLLFCAGASLAPAQSDPHIGYLYPAGGQQGQTVQVIVGGQFLRGCREAALVGPGIHVTVAGFVPNHRPVPPREQRELLAHINELLARQANAANAPMQPQGKLRSKNPKRTPPAAPATVAANGKTSATAKKDHPLLNELDKLNTRELLFIKQEYLKPTKKQTNPQIGDIVLLDVRIDPKAPVGDHELRLVNNFRLTNPITFQVGSAPEIREPDIPAPFIPYGKGAKRDIPERDRAAAATKGLGPLLTLPVVLNGRVMPAETDKFQFKAQRGQQLVIQVAARKLIPYLADAVPGWFQATVTLRDSKGTEVAYDDDYRFEPDPVLFYQIPKDGTYRLEIRDSLFRGREDFIYRIQLGTNPFVTGLFPLGGHQGERIQARLTGWNLGLDQVQLDTRPGQGETRQVELTRNGHTSNPIFYAVDTLPECTETEPNDKPEQAQWLVLPRIANGVITKPGDHDRYRFHGRAGEKIVAEITARRLRSPLDSLLRLTDEHGRLLAMNDDNAEKETGLLTHSADSNLSATLPADGVYILDVTDTGGTGSPAHAYRLRVAPPQPDFELRVTPSSINLAPGRSTPFQVHALRKDGFTGPIQIYLADHPGNFTLAGFEIPAGRDSVRMTIAPRDVASASPFALHLAGRATIAGQTVSHPAVPAEDMMQAFLYRQLVPMQALLACMREGRRNAPEVQIANEHTIQLPVGGSAEVRVKVPPNPMLKNIKLSLSDPPAGISMQDLTPVPGGVAFILKADAQAKPAPADNLIVEAFIEPTAGQPMPKGAKKNQNRVPLGVLPAIPYQVVQQ
jgi:hypothetical protein